MKVSVNILTKNRRAQLARAVQSVIAQNYSNWELVVVNDGSIDDTAEYLQQIKDSRIRVLHNLESRGIIYSRNLALKKSVGKYIAILDDDDEWTDPDKLALQTNFLESHPKYVLVGGGMEKVVEGKSLGSQYRSEQDRQIRKTMLLKNNFFNSTTMFSREVANEVGGYRENPSNVVEDYDLWLRLGQKGQMYNFPRVFCRYNAKIYDRAVKQKFLNRQLQLVQEFSNLYPLGLIGRTACRFRKFFNNFPGL